MSQITGNAAAVPPIGGMTFGAGPSGPLCYLWSSGDPNTLTDAKTALPNTWTAK